MKEEETVGPFIKKNPPPLVVDDCGRETAYPYIIYAKPKGGREERGGFLTVGINLVRHSRTKHRFHTVRDPY